MADWLKTWHAECIDLGWEFGSLGNMTQKIRIRNNVTAIAVKVQFTNQSPTDPLFITQAAVSVCDRKSGLVFPALPVTLNGSRQITIPPETTLYSDVTPIRIHPEEDLIVGIYLKSEYSFRHAIQTWGTESWDCVFEEGNTLDPLEYEGMTSQEIFPVFAADAYPATAAVAVCGVQMETREADVKTVACFGDSITHMSYYYSALQKLAYEKFPGKVVFLNYGIGGNRVIYDATYLREDKGHGICFGPAAVSRFVPSVYGEGSPDVLFFMEGINDCMHGLQFDHPEQVPTGQQIFEGIKTILKQARREYTAIVASTVLPFLYNPAPYDEGAEKIRQELNVLIREEGPALADAIVDLDKVMDDSNRPGSLIYDLQIGDGLHPNAEGGVRMAEAIFAVLEELIPKRRRKKLVF